MSNDRSARTLLAATLLLAAVFVAMNRAVVSAPLADWWLPIILAVLGLGIAAFRPRTRVPPSTSESQRRVREYLPPVTPPATPLIESPETAAIPQNTDAARVLSPASPETVGEQVGDVAVDESGGIVAGVGETPVAPEAQGTVPAATPTPASPQTPIGTVEREPAAEVPVSPATPEASAPPEPVPASPETAASVAKPAPEAQVVLESTADPAQSPEIARHGEITPEAAAQVEEGNGEDTHIASNLTEAASPRVTEQETTDSIPGAGDDLTRIDGIGQKTAAALRAAGIDSFQKLANISETQLGDLLRAAKVRTVGGTSSWAQQAAYAAQGDWEGLNRFIRERKARGGN